MFYSSLRRGTPERLSLEQVIPGWRQGIPLMVEGKRARFWIPSELAYGDNPSRKDAPAGMLVFDVELLEIVPSASR
jgi:peptidylprolyl isomerase